MNNWLPSSELSVKDCEPAVETKIRLVMSAPNWTKPNGCQVNAVLVPNMMSADRLSPTKPLKGVPPPEATNPLYTLTSTGRAFALLPTDGCGCALALSAANRTGHPLIITRAGARRREIFFNTIPPIIVNIESFFIVASYDNCSDGLARSRIPPLPLKERCGIAHFWKLINEY